ncbi:MAG: STAS domain-containing protein [Phycisphaerae bacterium]|jgi:anti-anti-sigma factor
MGIQDWSENLILATIAPEPEMSDELKAVTEIVQQRDNCSVVVDFSDADIITSSSLAQLLRLQKVLDDHNQRLVLCGTSVRTQGVFKVTGLDNVFEFVSDKFTALAGMQFTL